MVGIVRQRVRAYVTDKGVVTSLEWPLLTVGGDVMNSVSGDGEGEERVPAESRLDEKKGLWPIGGF